jgi:hypothetical protein
MSPVRTIHPTAYQPTIPRSGDTPDDAIFSMSNIILRGQGALKYAECYAGSYDLSETIATSALTGTLAVSTATKTVTGSGTTFVTELHLGQYVLVANAASTASTLLTVERIVSATSFITSQFPDFTESGRTGTRLPIIFAVDTQRGTALRGNVIRLDKGTLFSVGDGVFRLDGNAINSSLTLTRRPKISLYAPASGTYTSFTLGMPTSAAPGLAAVGGGSPGMQAGSYSIVITPARKETLGFNNPSTRADVTLATGDKTRITFPAMDTASGQNAWIVWGTTFAASLGADKNYLEGPWFKVQIVDDTQVSPVGGTFDVEWLDAEIERQDAVTFDNDAPTDAEFVVNFNNVPVYISCQGIPNAAGSVTSPGPFIVPAKPNNVEAAPLVLAFSSSPPEIIYGVTSGAGRLYLLTSTHLQVAQGTPQQDVPVIIQPFWHSGFTNPYQVAFFNGRLYGFPVSGPTRSASEGEEGSEEVSFAAAVQAITGSWVPARVMVAYDPVNTAICFFHACDSLNSSGYWTTRVLMFGVQQDKWIGDVTLTSTSRDMIVSGVATVADSLEFLAGGRTAGSTVATKTYTFDTISGESVPWRLAPAFSDTGDELRSHVIKRIRATAKSTSGSLGVFGFQPTQVIDISLLATGNSASLTGAISLPNTTSVALTQQFQVNCPNLDVSTIQIQGTWGGTGNKDRVDEILYELAPQGVRR